MKNMNFRLLHNTGAILTLTGAIFKLQHWPNGSSILFIGIVIWLLGYELEIRRLRKKVNEQEKKEAAE